MSKSLNVNSARFFDSDLPPSSGKGGFCLPEADPAD